MIMFIYTDNITPRFQFTAEFIGRELMGDRFVISSEKQKFIDTRGPKINYTNERITTQECWIKPHSILFENEIRDQSLVCIDWEGEKAFFQTESDLPFDIFAATFYLLSRYEEYLPHKKDIYGRYGFENSLAYKEGFLEIPLVNEWLFHFREWMNNKFPGADLRTPAFSFLPTYDIDEAWSYKYKNPVRRLGAAVKNFFKGETNLVKERRRVLSGEVPDPFDSYSWMDSLHENSGLRPYYFFLVAEKTGKYDRNILPHETALQELIKAHAKKYDIGIHPSWQSGDDSTLLKREMELLESISEKKITASRQHFIRFTLPETYRELLNAGIRKDFSMGYGSINGFRASVASPFYWYDLEKEIKTDLLLFPFCFMDANAFFEQKLLPAEALEEMLEYRRRLKRTGGMMIIIWHNTFLGTAELFKGWKETYESFVMQLKH